MAELVKQYTFEDFAEGFEPFEEVYAHRADKFDEDREIKKMAKIARSVGFTGFAKCYQAYKAKMHRGDVIIEENHYSDFTGQPIELNTGKWIADDEGISTFNSWGAEIFACVHPIMPVQRLVNVDTNIAKIRLAYRLGGKWNTCIVDKRTISSSSSIIDLADYGIAVNSENSKALVQYLHDVEYLNYDSIPEVKSVTRLGWIPNEGFSPYIKDLNYDGEESFRQMFEAVSQKGSADEWFDLAKDVRANGTISARIMLAASFASALVEPIGALPFFVHLWGGTETGKTVALMLATSVWAKPEVGEFSKTFNATKIAQEIAAGFVNSLPLVLDELQLQKDKKSFDSIIYMLTEGTNKLRATKTGGLKKTLTWRNCMLTTGEQPIITDTSGGGAMNRIIEINCEDRKLFKDPVRVSSIVKNNYGFAGKLFIEKLSDEILELAREEFTSNYLFFEKNATQKQSQSGALILTADQIITSLLFEGKDGLTKRDILQFLFTKDAVDVNKRALEWLRGWLVQNKARFEWLESDENQNIWGQKQGGTVRIIGHIFRKECEAEGYNARAFANWLCRNGYLEPDNVGNPTKPCSIAGRDGHVRCYVFRDKVTELQ